MQNSQNQQNANATSEIPMSELLNYHKQIAEQYKDVDPVKTDLPPLFMI